MFKVAAAFLLGVVILTVFTTLPHVYWAIGILPVILIFSKYPSFKWMLGLPLGFFWALVFAHLNLYPELDKSLEGVDLEILGKIVSIPNVHERSTRFEFVIHDVHRTGINESLKLPKKVRLNWYGKVPDLQLGEIWQLRVRLKRPWGFANPGSFDYEKWLFEHKIRATGYVRTKGDLKRVKETSIYDPSYYFRTALNNKIEASSNKNSAVIKALVLGERGQMDSQQWQLLTQTGTNHLLAISGLHIGIVSGFVYFIVVWIWKFSEKLCLRLPAQRVAAISAIFAAIFYAMLAGFSIPTQRAMVMAAVVFLSIYTMQSFRPWNILSLALLCVLILDPFSILAPGFWLSFLAVAIILLSVSNRAVSKAWGFHIAKIQIVLALGLLPITLLFFQQASLISPVANFFAVPWVSCLVVPLSLIGSLFLFVNEALGAWLLDTVNIALKVLWWVLEALHHLPFSSLKHAVPGWTLIPAVFGVLLLLAPKGWPIKTLSVALLSPLVFAKPFAMPDTDLKLSVLDVGQGTALVLQMGENILVYDTGPKYSSSFNAGEAIVANYLREQGLNKIEKLVISHGDKDHSGGLEGLLANIKVKHMIANQTAGYRHENLQACREGMSWVWNSVEFRFLHPSRNIADENIGTLSKNNSSCVLRISHPSGSILLTGDIERAVERALVKQKPEMLDVDLLIAPHHGSNSSSTTPFILGTSPDYVVFTTGYRNPYGFPDEKVVSRYEKIGSHLVNTAMQGMISFEISDKNGLQLQPGYRELRQRFWHTEP